MHQSDLYVRAKQFASENIAPFAAEIDESGMFPKEVFDKIADAGYFSLIIPEEFGGWGANLQGQADVTRAFSEACATVGVSYMMHNVAVNCVIESNDEMKQEVLKDIVENKAMCALCFSETGTGVHQVPEIEARFGEDSVTFNGRKAFVTCAEYAKYYLSNVTSQSGDDVDNWLIPSTLDGVSFNMEEWHGVGMKGNASCPMYLKDVVVPLRYRTNAEGKGLAQAVGTCMPFFLTGLASVSVGLSEAILAEAIAYSKSRTYSSGQALCEIETIQSQLSAIYCSVKSICAHLYDAVDAYIAGEDDAFVQILAARSHSSEQVIENARLGMRIGGGIAYNRESPMERMLRDSYAGQVMSPSTNVLNLWIGRLITDQPMV